MSHDKTNLPSRRSFVKGALLGAGTALVPLGYAAANVDPKKNIEWHPEDWRNKQPDMAYRRLGRSGLMVSEMVMGGSGDLNIPEKVFVHDEALERGVNYLDTATRYNRGQSEEAWGKFLNRPGIRDRVFLATKLSEYREKVVQLTDDLFKGLPSEKKEALLKQARDLMEERQVLKPGYFFKYFGSHGNAVEGAYLSHVIKKEYGFQRKWVSEMRTAMRTALEGSLRRLKTDVIDILHFPHGIRVAENLEDDFHLELATKLKQEGKIRFNGFSCHTDQPRILSRAAELGHIDVAMVAYNIANQGSMELPLQLAVSSGMGVIAMKAARVIHSDNPTTEPVPDWRTGKLNQVVPGDLSKYAKAYLWVLQNPNISAVISEFPSSEGIRENLSIVGKKVDLRPA